MDEIDRLLHDYKQLEQRAGQVYEYARSVQEKLKDVRLFETTSLRLGALSFRYGEFFIDYNQKQVPLSAEGIMKHSITKAHINRVVIGLLAQVKELCNNAQS